MNLGVSIIGIGLIALMLSTSIPLNSSGSTAWSDLTGIPANCTSGQFVYGLTTTQLLCSTPSGGSHFNYQCPTNEYLYNVTNTEYICAQINYNQLTGALYMTCPNSEVVYGNSSSGFKCESIPAPSYSYMTCPTNEFVYGNASSGFKCEDTPSPTYTYMTCPTNYYVYGNYSSGFYCAQPNAQKLTSYGYMTCPSGKFVTGNSSSPSGFICAQVAVSQLTGITYMTCSTNEFVYGNQSSGFKCEQPNAQDLTGYGYMTCPTNEYVYGNESNPSSFKCSQVNWNQLTGFPSACSAGEYISALTSSGVTCGTPSGSGTVAGSSSSTDSCTAGASKMAGLDLTYATSSSFAGNLIVTINFQAAEAEVGTGNTLTYTMHYGTGGAPSCGASATGTAVGKTYTIVFNGLNGEPYGDMAISETWRITGLSSSTTYWIDVETAGASPADWTLSVPQAVFIEA
jgi:hypothetical protein